MSKPEAFSPHDFSLTRAEYRAAYRADLIAWEAEAKAAIEAIRIKIGDAHWTPRSLLAIGIRPRPVAPGIEIEL